MDFSDISDASQKENSEEPSQISLTSINPINFLSAPPKVLIKKHRTSIDLQVKKEIIKFKDEHPSITINELANKFNVTRFVISRTLKFKEKLIKTSAKLSTKHLKSSYYPEVEEAILMWFKERRAQNIPIDGPIIQEKARIFANSLGISSELFNASEGWLSNFKQRNSIVFKSIEGESGEIHAEQTNDWFKFQLPALLNQYEPKNVFNADEFGLFFSALPDKSFSFSGQKCEGGKQSKIRITVLACCNMTGSEKLPLLVVGKSRAPRCFKNVKTLPVTYRANKRSWITSGLFEEWVRKLDAKFSSINRRVLLIVDNCPAHPKIANLTAIRINFLPPNTTALTQPLDQGIIQNIKQKYRKLLLQNRLNALDNNYIYSPNLLDAITMVNRSWSQVNELTISHCFAKAHFCEIPPIPEELDETISDLNNIFETLSVCTTLSVTSLQQYLLVDSLLETCGTHSDSEILAAASATFNDSYISSEEETETDTIMAEPPRPEQAREALSTLRSYISSRQNALCALNALDSIENFIDFDFTIFKKQSLLTDFFKAN